MLQTATAEGKVVEAMMRRLPGTIWAGRSVKLRIKDKDGKMEVGVLGEAGGR